MATLFDEVKIGDLTLKNRIVRTAMGDHGADEAGHLGETDFEGYRRVAEGGAAAFITGYSWVCDYPMGGRAKMMGAYDGSFAPELERLAGIAHAHGCAAIQQLVHIGSATACEGVDAIGPSAVPGPYNGQMPRPMEAGDFARVTKAFADAATRAKAAGLDGVEIHAAHRFLLSQFLSPAYNHRTDAYGSSDENRARLAAEVCGAVRAAVGPGFPVLFKVNCEDGEENGITMGGLLTAARMLEAAGASAIEVSGAWMTHKEEGPYYLEQTVAVAEAVGIPTIIVGGVRGRDMAERIVSETPIALIGMARPFTSDPGLVNEWRQPRG